MKSSLGVVETKIEKLPHLVVTENPTLIQADEYDKRIARVIKFMSERHLNHIVIYADREHFSNMEFLTGFDPRFEEALFILSDRDIPVLIVGNECMAYSDISPIKMKKILYQHFSLQGQPRDRSKTLEEIFRECGIDAHSKVGVVGMKYRNRNQTDEDRKYLDIPYYIANCIQKICGVENVVNAVDMMTHPTYGLRNTDLSGTEIALFEIAGTEASLGMENFLNNLRLGMTEIEASRLLELDGSPMPVYPNVNFGLKNALYGVASPSYHKRAELGDPISVSSNRRRALIARNGLLVRNKNDLDPECADIVENLYKPYFAAVVNWYETIGLGVAAGDVYQAVMEIIGDRKFGVSLNPGHQIHTEEWTNSPFFKGSEYKLRSGMAFQCDIIATPGGNCFGIHIEDGIVLADEQLRNQLKVESPQSWKRILSRRQFIRDVIGINLKEEVLPTSNLQLIFNPYMLAPNTILTIKKS